MDWQHWIIRKESLDVDGIGLFNVIFLMRGLRLALEVYELDG